MSDCNFSISYSFTDKTIVKSWTLSNDQYTLDTIPTSSGKDITCYDSKWNSETCFNTVVKTGSNIMIKDYSGKLQCSNGNIINDNGNVIATPVSMYSCDHHPSEKCLKEQGLYEKYKL